jgi:hypothetical protein
MNTMVGVNMGASTKMQLKENERMKARDEPRAQSRRSKIAA